MASDVFEVDVGSGDVRRLTDEGYALVSPAWSPDGRHLAVTGRPADNWYVQDGVFLLTPSTGEVRELTEGFEPTVSWYGSPRFVDDGTLVAAFGEAGWTRPYRLPLDGGRPRPVGVGLDRGRTVKHLGGDGGVLAWTESGPSTGHEVVAGPLLDGAAEGTRLTDFHEALTEAWPMPSVRRVETPSADVTVESILYYPDSFDPDDPTPHPLLLWPHGGPISYDDPEFSFDHAYFTSRGYLVCKPNYRGSSSYGRAFAEALRARWGSVEVDDLLAVVDDLVGRGWADPDLLFATGFSYGGIATGYLITRSDRFAAAAAEHGIYDLRSEFGVSDAQAWIEPEFGLPWEAPETFEASSSIPDVGGVETPTLITAGTEDWRCPPSQSEQLYVSLRKQGVPAKLVLYPGEHHNVGDPERAIHRLEQLAGWFERHDPAA